MHTLLQSLPPTNDIPIPHHSCIQIYPLVFAIVAYISAFLVIYSHSCCPLAVLSLARIKDRWPRRTHANTNSFCKIFGPRIPFVNTVPSLPSIRLDTHSLFFRPPPGDTPPMTKFTSACSMWRHPCPSSPPNLLLRLCSPIALQLAGGVEVVQAPKPSSFLLRIAWHLSLSRSCVGTSPRIPLSFCCWIPLISCSKCAINANCLLD